jgi:alanine-glyoxylate transaminase/serine-glyoxylate transaminase/serine-pyruvate transaminase
VPERVLRAMGRPTIDHRGPEFRSLGVEVLGEIRKIFKTEAPVLIFPASGTGAWEAALVNALSPGDKILMCETGHFAALWQQMARRLGFETEIISTDWRRGADPAAIERRLAEDRDGEIKAVCVVHNETSTGVASRIGAIRAGMDAARHSALLMVDTISSLGSIDYRMDEWGVDVTVAGSQKGLMLPPGLSFNGVSEKALAASKTARSRSASQPSGTSTAVRDALYSSGTAQSTSRPHALTARRVASAWRSCLANTAASPSSSSIAIASRRP